MFIFLVKIKGTHKHFPSDVNAKLEQRYPKYSSLGRTELVFFLDSGYLLSSKFEGSIIAVMPSIGVIAGPACEQEESEFLCPILSLSHLLKEWNYSSGRQYLLCI